VTAPTTDAGAGSEPEPESEAEQESPEAARSSPPWDRWRRWILPGALALAAIGAGAAAVGVDTQTAFNATGA
jgi:hypothetical protein